MAIPQNSYQSQIVGPDGVTVWDPTELTGGGNVTLVDSEGNAVGPGNPLPTDNDTFGAPSDGAYAGSGNATAIAALKGIFTKLTSTLNINIKLSGNDVSNSNTIPVTQAALTITNDKASVLPLKATSESATALVSVGTSSTLILAVNANRHSAPFKNLGTQTVFIGATGVTITTGWPVLPGETYIDEELVGAWYGVVASGSATMAAKEYTK